MTRLMTIRDIYTSNGEYSAMFGPDGSHRPIYYPFAHLQVARRKAKEVGAHLIARVIDANIRVIGYQIYTEKESN